MKNKKKIFIGVGSIVFVIIIAVSFFNHTPIWQRQPYISGSYQLERQALTLSFPRENNMFWVMYLGNQEEPSIYGNYRFLGENEFIFEGYSIGNFESFQFINRNLDIEVIIDGEAYVFRRVSDIPLGSFFDE